MIYFRLVTFSGLLFFAKGCTDKSPVDTRPLHANLLPSDAKPIETTISHLNCWVEQDKFFVTGICSNITNEWQKIWLEGVPTNAAGKPISLANHSSVILRTFSDAIPPNGRSSFFESWPLSDFSAPPVSCRLKVAGATVQASGPILVTQEINGMKMLVASSSGQSATEEVAWQISGKISNPLPLIAAKPRLEILVFGTDKCLWQSMLLNPEDESSKARFHFEREGPLQANENRSFTLQVLYEHLPQFIKEKKIGRVEILPFEAR